MRFMIIVKASTAAPDAALSGAMARYQEELAQAGVLLDTLGLHPGRQGWRVRFQQGRRRVVEGPFDEAGESIAACALIDVRSREEALEWSRRFPSPHGPLADGEIEVRQVVEPGEAEA